MKSKYFGKTQQHNKGRTKRRTDEKSKSNTPTPQRFQSCVRVCVRACVRACVCVLGGGSIINTIQPRCFTKNAGGGYS